MSVPQTMITVPRRTHSLDGQDNFYSTNSTSTRIHVLGQREDRELCSETCSFLGRRDLVWGRTSYFGVDSQSITGFSIENCVGFRFLGTDVICGFE